MTPSARSIREAKKRGWEIDSVERRLTRFVTKDYLGVIDLIALTPDGRTIGIQATSGANHAARVAKVKAEPRVARWFRCGHTIEVWSWRRAKPRGKRSRWSLRVETVLPGEQR
jgi:hypothetical protein